MPMRICSAPVWIRSSTCATNRFEPLYSEIGRPCIPTRVMVELHLLKHMFGLSDELVCERWVNDPYFQYFCGETFFQHELPTDRSSMTTWRERSLSMLPTGPAARTFKTSIP